MITFLKIIWSLFWFYMIFAMIFYVATNLLVWWSLPTYILITLIIILLIAAPWTLSQEDK